MADTEFVSGQTVIEEAWLDDVNDYVYALWTTPAFDAGNFTANGTMTWTVGSGDVTTYAYQIHQKKMTLSFAILTSTVGGSLNTDLRIAIPASKTATKAMGSTCFIGEPSLNAIGRCQVEAAGTHVAISKITGNMEVSTNQTTVIGQLTFQID